MAKKLGGVVVSCIILAIIYWQIDLARLFETLQGIKPGLLANVPVRP